MTDKAQTPFRRRQRRKLVLGLLIPSLFGAVVLSMVALRNTAVYFYSPAELPSYSELGNRQIRVGGLVATGSLADNPQRPIRFAITDGAETVPVAYPDILPGLFAEDKGVIVQGHLRQDGVFQADKVLAKHDENYMPAEVVEALKETGRWQEGEAEQ
ncbi:MAG: cytochrome c maturation protein CcmE [bacterium]